jgi:hypothetical protein
MQQEKIVLPKFTVPGQTNWAKWVLVGVGGLVVVNLVAFGLVVSKRSGVQATAVAPSAAAEVPAVPAAAARPTPPPSAAVATTATAPAAAQPEAAAAAAPAPVKAKAASTHRARRSHSSHKALAKAGSTGQRSSTGKADPLDELLKKFK